MADDATAFRTGSVTRELRVSSVPLIQFSGQLRHLLRYPYGCLEQIISRVFPLLYFADLAKELDPDLFEESSPSDLIRAGTRRIATMQLHSGGFGLWPSADTLHPWASIYATHFLVEARRAGHFVENFLYDGALKFLAEEIRAKASYGPSELQQTVYALYVLARAGEADIGTMDFVRQRHGEKLKPESRVLLGAAMPRSEIVKSWMKWCEDWRMSNVSNVRRVRISTPPFATEPFCYWLSWTQPRMIPEFLAWWSVSRETPRRTAGGTPRRVALLFWR